MITNSRPGLNSNHDLYLSPHYDDICYSLGSYVAGQGKGTMLVIFSRSNWIRNHAHVEHYKLHELPLPARIIAATAIRRGEDADFAARVGLSAVYCNLDEAPLRGRRPFEYEAAPEDTNRFSEQIMDEIRSLCSLANGRSPTLYCPVGIGDHVDHLVVRNTVLEHLPELCGMYTVCFYEDLNYASRLEVRRNGLRNFLEQIGPWKPRRYVLPVDDPERKLDLVEIYSSQLHKGRPPLSEFTLGTRAASRAMHEAVWVF